MKLRVGKLSETLERLIPFLTIVAIVTGGWFWFVQPRLGAYLRARTDAATLEERVRTLQQATSRVQPHPPADMEPTLHDFEARLSADDKVADVASALAQAVLASAPADKLRSFVIETGDRLSSTSPDGSGGIGRASAAGGSDGVDPRLALFPYAVSYTPLRVTFESTFDAAGNVLWRIHDLPTIVEVRSATLTRGLPLMKTELLVRVLQRGEMVDAERALIEAASAPPIPSSTAPRLAPSPADGGAWR